MRENLNRTKGVIFCLMDNIRMVVFTRTIWALRSTQNSKQGTDAILLNVKMLSAEGHVREALHLLESVDHQGTWTYLEACVCLLQACTKMKALIEGKQAHVLLMKSTLMPTSFHLNALIGMYAKCGDIEGGRRVFNIMLVRNVFIWTTMITAYNQNGRGWEALELFKEMQREGVQPDKVTFVSILSVCADLPDLQRGKQMHAYVIQNRCQSDPFVSSTLVDMYVKCGSIQRASEVFDSLPKRNIISWNAIIAGYPKEWNGGKVLKLFSQMQLEPVNPDEVTLICILNAYAGTVGIGEAKHLHAVILRAGWHSDMSVGNSLLDLYAKSGCPLYARLVFDNLPLRNVVSWTTAIAGYAQSENADKALELFDLMQDGSVEPNQVTFVNALSACVGTLSLEQGKRVHSHVLKSRCEANVFIGNTLIDLYTKCGSIEEAWQVFYTLVGKDIVSWSTIMLGFAQYGNGKESLVLFKEMNLKNTKLDASCFVSVLGACTAAELLEVGKFIHADILKVACELDMYIGSALIDMYATCGDVESAQFVFVYLPTRNVVSWSSLISGCMRNECYVHALRLVREFQSRHLRTDMVMFVNELSACAGAAALGLGKQVHANILKAGELNVFVGNAVVDMYAKCGNIGSACQEFDRLILWDTITWNALISGYAQHGDAFEAIGLFTEMQIQGAAPDDVTFISLLFACSHAQLIDEAFFYFGNITQIHRLTLAVEHHACVVDLLGRGGNLDEAGDLLNMMPLEPSMEVWTSILGAYRLHGDPRDEKHLTRRKTKYGINY